MIAPAHPRPIDRPRHLKRSNYTLLYGLIGFSLTALLGLIAIGILGTVYYFSTSRIPEGVTVAGIDVGGMSAENAINYLGRQNPNSTLMLVDGNRTWMVNLVDLGISIDYAGTAEKALAADEYTSFVPSYIIDLNQTQTALVALSQEINLPAVSGRPPQMGRSLEIPVMLDRFRADAAGELMDGMMELSMIEVAPPPLPAESINRSSTQTTTHIVEAGQELGLIAKMYGVSVEDILAVNDIANPNVISVGEELVIPAAGVYQPSAAQAPAPSTNTGKAIVVSTSEQRIYAYENGVLIHSHLTSTGRAETPTVLGDYKIYVKYEATDMSGPGYYLPQVPYTMYFFEGYGIHGTYWHNSFGRPMSHGCVNLPTDEARWFFEWAEVGTPVRVV